MPQDEYRAGRRHDSDHTPADEPSVVEGMEIVPSDLPLPPFKVKPRHHLSAGLLAVVGHGFGSLLSSAMRASA